MADDVFLVKPYWLNQYIAGYQGYLALQTLAGYSTDESVRTTYERLLDLRVSGFDKDSPFPPVGANDGNWELAYQNSLAIARNFMFLTPELAAYLGDRIYDEVEEAVAEYEYVAPYWFVSKFDNSYGEGSMQHLYDYPALFQAKAGILRQPYAELVKWIDVPAFAQGDLFYIQNLVVALSAKDTAPIVDFALDVAPPVQVVEVGGVASYVVRITHDDGFTETVTVQIGASPAPELVVDVHGALQLAPPGGEIGVTLTDLHEESEAASEGYHYRIPITATAREWVKNAYIDLLVTTDRIFLPTIQRSQVRREQ